MPQPSTGPPGTPPVPTVAQEGVGRATTGPAGRRGQEDWEALSQTLAAAQRLGTGPHYHRLQELAGRLEEQRLRVLVPGEAKRGKSTLVNGLLGRDLLPAGVTPLTSPRSMLRVSRAAVPSSWPMDETEGDEDSGAPTSGAPR